jgi:hypothetical protein
LDLVGDHITDKKFRCGQPAVQAMSLKFIINFYVFNNARVENLLDRSHLGCEEYLSR